MLVIVRPNPFLFPSILELGGGEQNPRIQIIDFNTEIEKRDEKKNYLKLMI